MRPRPHVRPMALSLMSTGRNDVRPALVSLFYSDDTSSLADVLRYGLVYLSIRCGRFGWDITAENLQLITAHSLLRLWKPLEATSRLERERAKECEMRAQSFRQLSDWLVTAYKRRLTEGAARFIEVAVDDTRPLPEMTYRPPLGKWWRSQRNGPCVHVDGADAERWITGRPAQPGLVKWIQGDYENRPRWRVRTKVRTQAGKAPDLDPSELETSGEEFQFEDQAA